MEKQITAYQPGGVEPSLFSTSSAFEHGQRIALMLSKSELVPKSYQGASGVPNCMVALELANRIGMSPLMVMQNLHIIEGKPSWSSTFMIASLNSCGKFSPLRFEFKDLGKKQVKYTVWVNDGTHPNGKPKRKPIEKEHKLDSNRACRVVCYDLANGEKLEGPWVSVEMAICEGWYHRNGSKWPTMEDSMLMYRSASFFGRLYAPEIGMGMKTADEVEDIEFTEISSTTPQASAATPSKAQKVEDVNAEAEKPGKKAEKAPPVIEEAETEETGEYVGDPDGDPDDDEPII